MLEQRAVPIVRCCEDTFAHLLLLPGTGTSASTTGSDASACSRRLARAENENCQEDVLEIESQACVSHLSDALGTDVHSAAGRLLVGLSGDSKCLSDGRSIMTATKKEFASNSSLIRFSCHRVFEFGCVLQLEKTKEEKNDGLVSYLPSNCLVWCQVHQLA